MMTLLFLLYPPIIDDDVAFLLYPSIINDVDFFYYELIAK
jgi:hypothetical protein